MQDNQHDGPRMPWAPRVLLTERLFRLPIQAKHEAVDLQVKPFVVVDQRWSEQDAAFFYYLRAPAQSGNYVLRAVQGGQSAEVVVQVRTLNELRRAEVFNGVDWPRRWPVGQTFCSTKKAQTLQDEPVKPVRDRAALDWWMSQDDGTVWRQLPAAEFPRAHYVNVNQGCPQCGTAIFAHHGFYPWVRQYQPLDLRSTCPSCAAVFPSNDLAAGDYSSGDFVDDGFGYFDADGKVFLFAASYHRDLVSRFNSPIELLTARLRQGPFEVLVARHLGLLLLRYAVETLYLAAVPQFRHGPSQEEEQAWDWGQPDWAAEAEPIKALYRKGMMRYSIDIPIIAASLALAYDTIWPFLQTDGELVERAQALGVDIACPADAVVLIEEMLASLLQCCIDGGGVSNLPRVSEGVLFVLRGLDRPDAQDVMTWLYEQGPGKLQVFGTNNFFPDGTPPEATGGYNNTHTCGLFALEDQLARLRFLHPDAYPVSRFPSMLEGPRAACIVSAPYKIALLGKVPLHFGDGGSAGMQHSLEETPPLAPLPKETLEQAAVYLKNPSIRQLGEAADNSPHRQWGSTVLDGAGFAVLRTGETPERAAAGVIYGDATGHRHMDLLDVQLYAFDRPFLSDLGYPQSWGSVKSWEGDWATHNALWGVVPQERPLELPFDTPWPFLKAIAGRGRLVRAFVGEGIHLVEIEAERWVWDLEENIWRRPGVHLRRLVALVETDGEGVALIDLARVRGGTQHWRICRGLEGAFDSAAAIRTPRPGTLAGADIVRGAIGEVDHPDHVGLAWMDDVASLEAPAGWQGTWTSRHDAAAQLDLYQVHVSDGVECATAQATAVLGEPSESRYEYRTLAWKNCPAEDASTCIDLVFEPRMGTATLARVDSLAVTEGGDSASGVRLLTHQGKHLSFYWAPEAGLEDRTCFADGTVLEGSLAMETEDGIFALGAAHVQTRRGVYRFAKAAQRGRLVGLDRDGCTVEVEGLSEIAVGDRVKFTTGRNYRVEAVTPLADGRLRLQLDVSSVLGRARVVSLADGDIALDFFLMTRTGYLHGTRMEHESGSGWAEIVQAMNPDVNRTVVRLNGELEGLSQADWVRAVAYVIGDEVIFEPLCRG
jgi:hypothetical protein